MTHPDDRSTEDAQPARRRRDVERLADEMLEGAPTTDSRHVPTRPFGFDASSLDKLVFEEGIASQNAVPYAAIFSDFEFSHGPSSTSSIAARVASRSASVSTRPAG